MRDSRRIIKKKNIEAKRKKINKKERERDKERLEALGLGGLVGSASLFKTLPFSLPAKSFPLRVGGATIITPVGLRNYVVLPPESDTESDTQSPLGEQF